MWKKRRRRNTVKEGIIDRAGIFDPHIRMLTILLNSF